MSVLTPRRLLFGSVLATLALLAGLAFTTLRPHSSHDAPGKTPAAAPVTDAVRHVGRDDGAPGGHSVIEGNRLYVGAYGRGMRIFDISKPAAPRLIGSYLPGVRLDAVPDVAVFDGRHIAALNGTARRAKAPTDNTEFLDVTDPAKPKVLWTFKGPEDGEAHNGDIVDARRLWLPSGGTDGNALRIYDLNPLLGATPGAPRNLFRGDLWDLWRDSPHRKGRATGLAFTSTHDISVYTDYPVRQANGAVAPRDIALLAEGGYYEKAEGNTGSMFVIDITDPRKPVVLNRWLHQRGTGHHPIRYHHEAQFLQGDRSVVIVTDEDTSSGCGKGGGAVALRVSPDLTQAQELSEWFIPAETSAPECSVHVFSSLGALVVFGSYNAGLQVVDYSNPAKPVRVAHSIQPRTSAWGATIHGRQIYVGDTERGLDVFTIEDPELLRKLTLQVRPLKPA